MQENWELTSTANRRCKAGAVRSSLLAAPLSQRGSGSVHSKFASGFNIWLHDSLLYIGSSLVPLSVIGLHIPPLELAELLNFIQIGDVVVNKPGCLWFYTAMGLKTLAYEDVPQICLALPQVSCRRRDIASSSLYRQLKTIPWASVLGLALENNVRQYLELLAKGKDSQRLNGRVIRFFVGRGQGLTPSGDDMLLGFTLALLLFADFALWRKALGRILTRKRTTVISEAYCQALLAGFVSQPLWELVRALDSCSDAVVQAAADKVAAIGHTSGYDTLFGFYTGLTFLSKHAAEVAETSAAAAV